jgi:Fic family protein
MERLQKRLHLDKEIVEFVYATISEIDAVKKSWNYITNVTKSMLVSEKTIQSTIVISTGASNRIEGNLLTDDEIDKIYNNLSDQKLISRNEKDVRGYLEILELIFESHDEIKLSETNILYFHKKIMENGGSYKNSQNRVEAKNGKGELLGIVFEPTPPFLVPKEMSELINWYFCSTDKKHPLILIANFIFEFLAIHPFSDGNGRMSRLLTNLLLLQNGYNFIKKVSHEAIIEKRKSDYYLALRKTQNSWKQEHENIYPWLKFFLEIVKEQSENVLDEK